ncbi:MAG: hypothetical protein FI707_01720 [SAR202 cluster bacterium]|jgi:formate C-acetyltransferase|nr:hypothetical protein [Chloroflexota bacterium]MDP6420818.1 pyruvate formate lyase family protein [SAR202 cluster bacterium]MDP6662448.1 pyruvate formate lyase family protein [SAR202 cluster bacterium]MDP6799777.1 pyruvate formate lyase family protein [SAR202 cluster bacterium]MQG58285.1 hypothetical protein [SAR202 cluster bacterium]|tara:strand:- start:2513 stop:4945 length:2433 start_codon:yes stop_codon:yes gene_type:complete
MATSTTAHVGESNLEAARIDASLREKTPRVQRLYTLLQERMTRPQTTWGSDVTVLNDPELVAEPLVVRRARAFEKALQEMPIALEDDDLVVGNNVLDGVVVRTQLPGYATAEEYDRASDEGASIFAHLAHKTPHYSTLIDRGLASVLSDIDAKLAEIGARPASTERDEKLALFWAMRIEVEAVIGLADRYVVLAETLAGQTQDSARQAELLTIADIFRRVPEQAATSFQEAVQSFWLVHFAMFSTGTAVSCGRLDQYLQPFLEADLASGAITLVQAQELIDSIWLRFNDRGQIVRENFFVDEGEPEPDGTNGAAKKPKSATVVNEGPKDWVAGHRKRHRFATDAADAINHFGQNILLGGIRPDGSDGTNELTYLCLNSLEKFALTSPVVTARLHKGSPPEVVDRVAEVLKAGSGMPYVNNDDAIVQAYVDLGVTLEDARDYANSNCWETMIEGKSDQELIRGMNFLLFMELALDRGKSLVHGQMGPDTGDPREFKTFDDLMTAWKAQTDCQLQQGIDLIGEGVENGTLEHSNHGKYAYNPFLSTLTLDCIANEEDVIRGGARYTIWHVMGEGVANAVDSMAAVKKMVYDDESVSMDELLDALENDWEGAENLRRRLVARAPKFANDDEAADTIGKEMMDYFVERSQHHAARHPTVIYPGSVGTFSWYAMIGKEVAATPDGRRIGEPIAANFSPAPGTDVSGPTAAINSYLKMPVGPLAAGAPLDLRLSSSGLMGDPGTQRLSGLITAFIVGGGNMLTLTVTDVEELKRAMEDPENYRHLRVRMGGWSAYFVMLSKEQQLLHIRRVEHGLI